MSLCVALLTCNCSDSFLNTDYHSVQSMRMIGYCPAAKKRRIGKILWVMIFEENGSEQAPAPDVALVLSPVGMACEQALAWPTGLIPMPSATSLLTTENCPSDIELLCFARIKSIRRY